MGIRKIEKCAPKARLLALLIVTVCAIVVIVHWPALSAKALSFDDDEYLVSNPLVQNPSFSSAWHFFSEILRPSTVRGYYQPLTMISLMLDRWLGGRTDNLMVFHRTSLALHAANTALVIVLLYLLFGQPWTAAGVGLLFGLHPMTVETIPWIGERKTLLAAFFAIWCLILYIRYAQKGGWKLYIGCSLFYLLALMSKPTSTLLPVLMLLMDFWPLRRLKLKTLFEKIPFFLLGCISAVITYISQSRTAGINPPTQGGIVRVFFILCHNIIYYIFKIVWPSNLSSHYPFPDPLNLSQPMVLAGVIGTCILIPLLLISLKWTRAAFTGWLFFFIAILPAMQIIGFSNVIAGDKFAYLPSIGLLMVLTAFLNWFCFNANIGKNILRYVMVFIIVLILGCGETVATRRYIVYWRDSISLYQHMLSLAPKASILYYTLGIVYDNLGRYQDAVNACKEAIRIKPDYELAYNNLGVLYYKLGRYQEAADAYEHAIRIKPNYVYAQNNLGVVYCVLGRYLEAVDACEQAILIKPDYAEAYYNLGNAYFNLGRYQDAIEVYRQAIKIKPDYAEAHYNLGISYLSIDDKDSATEEHKILKTLDAEKANKLFNLINK